MDDKFLVCVRCFTFNHAPYIEDALNGFCMQETTFPFVCTIVDDASTDGEQEVIKKYLQEHFDLEDSSVVRNEETDDYALTFARHKTNKNCYFAVLYLKYNHYSIKKTKMPYIKEWHDNSKYIALCEGDDYWIVPNKLQMQVNYMEKHQNVSLTHTAFSYLLHEKGIFKESKESTNRIKEIRKRTDNYIPFILDENVYRIQTCSSMLRVSAWKRVKHHIDRMKGLFLMGDTQLWCLLNYVGTIFFFDECTCVYRIHEKSACRPVELSEKKRFRLSSAEMRVYMGQLLNLPPKEKKKHRKKLIICLADYLYFNKNYQPPFPLTLSKIEWLKLCFYKSKIGRTYLKIIEQKRVFYKKLKKQLLR